MHVNRNIIANYIGQVWAALLQLAFIPLYVRYLGVESFGLIGVFAILQAGLTLLDLGITPTLNREMARYRAGAYTVQSINDLMRTLELICIALAALAVMTIGTAAGWIAQHWLNLERLDPRAVGMVLIVMGLAAALKFVESIYQGAALGLQKQVRLNTLNAGFATVRAVGALLTLAFLSPTIHAFFIFQCAVSAVQTLSMALYVRWSLPKPPVAPGFSVAAIRGVWNFAAGLSAIALLSLILMQADKLLLAKLLPLRDYGYFTLAVTLTGALSLMIAPIFNVAYPRLTELVTSNDLGAFTDEYHRFAQLIAISVLPTALIFACFSREIVFLWTRDSATTEFVAPIVSVWIIGTALNGLMHLPYAAQLAHGWSRLTIIINCITVVLMVPALLYFVPRFGAIAAAWIWLAINAGYVVFTIGAMHHRILRGEKWRWYAEDVAAPLTAGALVAGAMVLIHRFWTGMSQGGEAFFLLAGLASGILLAAATTRAGTDLIKTLFYAAFKRGVAH